MVQPSSVFSMNVLGNVLSVAVVGAMSEEGVDIFR